jgi:hypothetical protein
MLGTLRPVPLTPDKVAQVLPLARSLLPALELDAWSSFARRRIGGMPDSGIIGLQDRRGYFHGLLGYEVRNDLLGGRILAVDWATSMELFGNADAVALLARELDAMATRLGCAGIEIRLKPEQRRLRRWLEREGHTLQSVVIEKKAAAG